MTFNPGAFRAARDRGIKVDACSRSAEFELRRDDGSLVRVLTYFDDIDGGDRWIRAWAVEGEGRDTLKVSQIDLPLRFVTHGGSFRLRDGRWVSWPEHYHLPDQKLSAELLRRVRGAEKVLARIDSTKAKVAP